MPLYVPNLASGGIPFGTFVESAATNTTMQTNTANGASVVTVAGAGTALRRGTTTAGAAAIWNPNGQYILPVYDKNPVFWGSFDDIDATVGQSFQVYITMDSPGNISSPIPTTTKYVGFKLKNNNGTKELYSVHCDGTNAEVATLISGVNFNNIHTVVAAMTSGSKIDFYVDGTLGATHTINLPSGAMNGVALYIAAGQGSAGTTDQAMAMIHGLGLSYDAY